MQMGSILSALALSLAMLVTGCASYKSIIPIKDDILNVEAGFDSVLIIRIKVIDETKTLKDGGYLNLFDAYLADSPSDNRLTQHIIDTEWQETPTAAILASEMRFSIVSGRHELMSVGTISSGYAATVVRALPIKGSYVVPKHAIAYLGEVQVTVRSADAFDVKVVTEPTRTAADVDEFRKAFPRLWDTLQGNVQVVTLDRSAS